MSRVFKGNLLGACAWDIRRAVGLGLAHHAIRLRSGKPVVVDADVGIPVVKFTRDSHGCSDVCFDASSACAADADRNCQHNKLAALRLENELSRI
jgi:hypothetical protein